MQDEMIVWCDYMNCPDEERDEWKKLKMELIMSVPRLNLDLFEANPFQFLESLMFKSIFTEGHEEDLIDHLVFNEVIPKRFYKEKEKLLTHLVNVDDTPTKALQDEHPIIIFDYGNGFYNYHYHISSSDPVIKLPSIRNLTAAYAYAFIDYLNEITFLKYYTLKKVIPFEDYVVHGMDAMRFIFHMKESLDANSLVFDFVIHENHGIKFLCDPSNNLRLQYTYSYYNSTMDMYTTRRLESIKMIKFLRRVFVDVYYKRKFQIFEIGNKIERENIDPESIFGKETIVEKGGIYERLYKN